MSDLETMIDYLESLGIPVWSMTWEELEAMLDRLEAEGYCNVGDWQ